MIKIILVILIWIISGVAILIWHWLIEGDVCSISETIYIPKEKGDLNKNKQYNKIEEDWIQRILDLIYKEFAEYYEGDELECRLDC